MSKAPGWYPDPHWMGRERYWDGQTWTDQSRLWEGGRRSAPAAPLSTTPRAPSAGQQPSRSLVAQPQVGLPPAPPPRTRRVTVPRADLLALPLILIGEAAVIAPGAYALHLRWPIWGAAVPIAVWWLIALLPAMPRLESAREPNGTERPKLETAWQELALRAGLDAGRYRLLVTDRNALNACASSGQLVVVTSQSARSLTGPRMEAVLAHELGHRSSGLSTRLSWPSRLLWWTLRTLWTAVGSMWKRAVEWHRPIGFLLVFLLAATATAFTVLTALPTAIAYAVQLAMRPLTIHTEFRADAFAARLGLGPDLLATIEHQLESTPSGKPLPLPLVRRAEHLRRHLITRPNNPEPPT